MLPSALRNEEPAQLSDRFSERGCDVGRSTAASRAISPERTLRWEQEPVTASNYKLAEARSQFLERLRSRQVT
jgi:hypothetical protein